ncbi:MAG: hypothetical protein ABI678_08760 [Kofleriaceae bacterium]
MSWWNLRGTNNEWMGDSSADAASDALVPLSALVPKPTLDQVLDALEVVFADGALVSGEALGAKGLTIRDRPRVRTTPQRVVVEMLGSRMPTIVASYRKHFHRAPTLRELVYSISFVLVSDVAEYTADQDSEPGYIEVTP